MKVIYRIGGLLMMVCGVLIMLYFRFSNPDMTDIRFFIEYWYIVVENIFVGGIGAYFYGKSL